MTSGKKFLIENSTKIHTTKLGLERISKNVGVTKTDIIFWCNKTIFDETSLVERKGKNYYVIHNDITITINANSLTIITAHKN